MPSADPNMRVEVFAGLADLPDDAAGLFGHAGSFFSTRAWWDAVLAHAIPAGAEPRLLLIRHDRAAAALFPMLLDRAGEGFRALTTPYTCIYEPLIADGALDHAAIFATFARFCRSFPTTRIDALNEATQAAIGIGGRRAGLAVARFDHFGNWHEDVAGLDWAAWLARRPGALRETIRRRSRRAERVAGAQFRVFRERDEMTDGIAAFETVYARSWKEPEPYPAFNPAQIRAAASLGLARLGVWWIDETPAAAQFWIVEHDRAMVLKLAHDEAFKMHSPGTVLTAWIIRHMIQREHVRAIDFGRGDDPYKQGWVADREQRIGLLLINPRKLSGMIALARHGMGRMKARLRLRG